MSTRHATIKALGEIALRVNDLETMQNFYQQVIGLELMKRFPNVAFLKIAEGYGGHVQSLALFDRSGEVYGPQIHSSTPDGVSPERSTLDHLAFEIDLADFQTERTRLEGLGLEVEVAEHAWTKWRSIYVLDPEGNTVELVCFDESLEAD